jgi:hypothetical protein
MIYFLALLPATALTVAGYFVLFLSSRTDGALRTFGKYLGFWAFTLAGLVILGAIFAAAHGRHRGPFAMHAMHGRMHGEGPVLLRAHGPWPERPGPEERPGPPAGMPPEGSGTPAQTPTPPIP